MEREKRTERLNLKILPSVKAMAAKRATVEGRSVSNYIETLIKKDYEENGTMKIKRLFAGTSAHDNMMVLEALEGEFKKFNITPARKIKESELIPVPFYQAKGKKAKEAENRWLEIYGLEKKQG